MIMKQCSGFLPMNTVIFILGRDGTMKYTNIETKVGPYGAKHGRSCFKSRYTDEQPNNYGRGRETQSWFYLHSRDDIEMLRDYLNEVLEATS